MALAVGVSLAEKAPSRHWDYEMVKSALSEERAWFWGLLSEKFVCWLP